MKKGKLLTFILALMLILVPVQSVFTAEMDPTLKKLELSGFLRMRGWYTTSKSKVPGQFPETNNYDSVYYQDLFLRNRLYLKALPDLEIRTVFDVISVMGKDDFSIGNGGTNLVTRDVYVVFKPNESALLEIGLKPFSLPGGYILARDATGIQYYQDLFKRRLRFYGAVVKAFDDANDSYGEQTEPPEYADDNVYFAGGTINLMTNFSSEVYYVYENDKYTNLDETTTPVTITDGRKASLHWIGMHNKLVAGNWVLRLGGIFNKGYIRELDEPVAYPRTYTRTNIKAYLGEFETSYRFSNLQIGLAAEGASGDPNDASAKNSFQDIKSSHGFSYIVVDNLGGISLRGSGESSWYGLYGGGLHLKLTLLDSLSMEMKFLHFRTTKKLKWRGKSSNWLGDECDLRMEYIYQQAASIFLTAGFFKPDTAYSALTAVNHSAGGVVAEIMLGGKVVY